MYYQMMIDAAGLIYDSVSYDDPSNTYSIQRQLALEKAQVRKKSLESNIEVERDKINKSWEEALDQIAAAAAANARQNYINDHHEEHEARLRNVEKEFTDEIDIAYSECVNEINEQRRIAARQQFENAITHTLITIDGEYRRMLDEEQEIREEKIKQLENSKLK